MNFEGVGEHRGDRRVFLGACSSNLVGLESRRSFDLMMKPCCRLTNLILLDSTRHFALDRFAFSISLSPSSLVSFVFAAKVSSNRDQKEGFFRNKSRCENQNCNFVTRHLSTFHLSLSSLPPANPGCNASTLHL